MKKVYLAGGKSQAWRKRVNRKWRGLAITFDPFTDSRQGAVYQFTNDDLNAIRSSDVVFAVVDYHVYTGLAAEVGFAHALGIPVILVWDVTSEYTPGRVETFITACSAALFVDVDEAADFTKRRYLE